MKPPSDIQKPPEGFRLRSATRADGPEVQKLIFGVLREFGLCPEPAATDADLLDIEVAYGSRGGWFMVLEEESTGTLVGSVALLPRSASEVELRKMYLSPAHRGRGLGRFLLSTACDEARRRGFHRMVLETAAALERAVRLYESAGFTRSDAKPHACRCEIVMSLDLQNASMEDLGRRSMETHYERLLGPIYGWMVGDFEAAVERATQAFRELGIGTARTGGASEVLDLGCGHGVHSVALARLGHAVTAVDLSDTLLQELAERSQVLAVRTARADLVGFLESFDGNPTGIVCLGDTLTHLPSVGAVRRLLDLPAALLGPGGFLVLGFRDYSGTPPVGDARFIPVRSDADRIHTCFLEYLETTVRVHDLVHTRKADGWTLQVGSYSKLRLAPADVSDWMRAAGFSVEDAGIARGMRTLVGRR
jgi:GNAT superfamily N-acetyltransferase/SAM-dependent methyltransferase